MTDDILGKKESFYKTTMEMEKTAAKKLTEGMKELFDRQTIAEKSIVRAAIDKPLLPKDEKFLVAVTKIHAAFDDLWLKMHEAVHLKNLLLHLAFLDYEKLNLTHMEEARNKLLELDQKISLDAKAKLTNLNKLKDDYLGKAGDASTTLKRYIPYKAMEKFMIGSKIPWHTVIHAHHVSPNPFKVLRFFNHHDEYHPYTHGLMEVEDLVTGETHRIAHSYTHPSFTTQDTIYGSSGQVLCNARGSNHFNTWKDGCAKLDPFIPDDESCKSFTKRFHSPPHHPKMGLCRALLSYGLL